MHFLLVNVTFYDAVIMIHDFIRTDSPFPYTAKFMFFGLEAIEFNKSDIKK